MKEAKRVAKHYFQAFEDNATAVETFNIDGMNGDTSQWTKWQAFSATAALHCLHQSLAGIGWSRGGLFYIPADDKETIEVRKFIFGGNEWNISISGSGSFVSSMKLNGIEIAGTMQIPEDLVRNGKNCLEIIRSDKTWEKLVLLYATDLLFREFQETEQGYAFTVSETGFSPLKLYAEKQPSVLVNGTQNPVEFYPDEKIAWIDFLLHKNDKVEIRTENKI